MQRAGETYEARIVREVLAMIDAEEARNEPAMSECLVRAILAGKALREEQRVLGHLREVAK